MRKTMCAVSVTPGDRAWKRYKRVGAEGRLWTGTYPWLWRGRRRRSAALEAFAEQQQLALVRHEGLLGLNVLKGCARAERGEPPMREDFPAGTSPGRTQIVRGQVEGRRAEAVVVVRWVGRNGQKNLCRLNRVLLQTPGGKPMVLSFSSPLRRAGVCHGRCRGCRVPSGSAMCRG